jgi:hypothetical protein
MIYFSMRIKPRDILSFWLHFIPHMNNNSLIILNFGYVPIYIVLECVFFSTLSDPSVAIIINYQKSIISLIT